MVTTSRRNTKTSMAVDRAVLISEAEDGVEVMTGEDVDAEIISTLLLTEGAKRLKMSKEVGVVVEVGDVLETIKMVETNKMMNVVRTPVPKNKHLRKMTNIWTKTSPTRRSSQ